MFQACSKVRVGQTFRFISVYVSVRDSHRCKVLYAAWKIIWARRRLIQLSAASTPVSVQISDCTLAPQKAQTASRCSQRAGPTRTGAEESCVPFRLKDSLSAGTCFRLQAVGAAHIPSVARLQSLYSFIPPLAFSAAISRVHPRFTDWGCVRKELHNRKLKPLQIFILKVLTVICEEELNFTKEN